MRVRALVKRIMIQMLRDKRTLALLFIAPLLILSLMYVLFNGGTVSPKLGVKNVEAALIQILEVGDIEITTLNDDNLDAMAAYDLDGILQCDEGQYILTLENSDPSVSKMLQIKLSQLLGSVGKPQANQISSVNLETHYLYGEEETSLFDVMNPILIGVFVFFFVFLISGIGLLRERTTGTLERLMSTPISKIEVVMGYLIGYGIFAIIQTVLVVIFSIQVLDIMLVGSIWHVILINLLAALVALSLGILLSTFASSEFQMVQFIPLVIVPQLFLSGIFSLEGMATWVQNLAKIMPVYHIADALKGIMYKGWGLTEISGHIMVLVSFAIIFVILNIVSLKKYRK
ncbi:MAG: ABC transporter permease [Turicibacter sp.]